MRTPGCLVLLLLLAGSRAAAAGHTPLRHLLQEQPTNAPAAGADEGSVPPETTEQPPLPVPAPDRVITLRGPVSAAAAGAVQSDLVPGEYIVRLSSDPACSDNPAERDPDAKAAQLQGQFSSISIAHIYRGLFKGFQLVIPSQQQQDPMQQQPAAPTPAAAAEEGEDATVAAEAVAAAAAAGDSLAVQVLQTLEADPCVRRVDPNRKVFAVGLVRTVAAGETVPVGIQRVKAASKSKANKPASVGIAIIDTGIAPHRDLNIAGGVDCTRSPCAETGARKPIYLDQNGHGTHVAGVVGARNNGKAVLGVAPGSRLFAVRVLDAAGEGSFANIIRGLDWVQAHNAQEPDPDKRIRVVNLSLGGASDHKADTKLLGPRCQGGSNLHKAICEISADKKFGAVVVVAATNDGVDLETAVPAAYPEVLTVTAIADDNGKGPGLAQAGRRSFTCGGSTAYDDSAASFSNYVKAGSAAESHTVAAPGVCIMSTWPGGLTARLSGTSMAAPHVSGILALCFSPQQDQQPGPCQAVWQAGGGPGVVKFIAGAKRFRQTGRGGFQGDKDGCDSSSKSCRHFGYLVSAESL